MEVPSTYVESSVEFDPKNNKACPDIAKSTKQVGQLDLVMVSHFKNTRALFPTCRLRHVFSFHCQHSPGDVSFSTIHTHPFYTHFADFGKCPEHYSNVQLNFPFPHSIIPKALNVYN